MKKFGSVWLVSLLCKLILAVCLPLTTDEAYYWVWSQRLQLSYYDHPPMVAWLFWLGHFFENVYGTVFTNGGAAARWPAVFLGHLTLLVWFFIWKVLFPKNIEKFKWWFWLTLFSPLLGFGSLIITPDLPVVFFWSLSTLFLIRSMKSQSSLDFACLGAALGLGFLSKYHIVLFLPLALIFLTVEKKWTGFRLKNILITFFTGLLFCSPVLIWNYQHEFKSFLFQLDHGLGRDTYEFFWTWSYLTAQILIIFPSVFYLALKAKLFLNQRILLYLGWGPILFFFLSSFRGAVEVNWPIVAYPAIFAMAVSSAERIKSLRITMAFWITLFCLFASHIIHPWMPNAPDKLSEFSQYEPVLLAQRRYAPLYTSNYQMASWLWYQSKKPIFKLNGMSRKDLFDDFPESKPSQFPIYLAMPEQVPLPPWIEENKLSVTEIEKLQNNLVIVKIGPP